MEVVATKVRRRAFYSVEKRTMQRRKHKVVTATGDDALTWFFVGLLVVSVMAGLLGQGWAG